MGVLCAVVLGTTYGVKTTTRADCVCLPTTIPAVAPAVAATTTGRIVVRENQLGISQPRFAACTMRSSTCPTNCFAVESRYSRFGPATSAHVTPLPSHSSAVADQVTSK